MRIWSERATLPQRAIALGVVLAGVYGLVVEPRWIEVTHPTLRARGVVAPLRVLHLTDLHGVDLGAREKRVLRVMNDEKPDLVVITGDTSDRASFGSYREFLASLHAPLGVFAVKGNWEHWAPAADEATTYASAGITLLVDDARRLSDDLSIVGFDDETAAVPDVERAMRSVPTGVATIALMHVPDALRSCRAARERRLCRAHARRSGAFAVLASAVGPAGQRNVRERKLRARWDAALRQPRHRHKRPSDPVRVSTRATGRHRDAVSDLRPVWLRRRQRGVARRT